MKKYLKTCAMAVACGLAGVGLLASGSNAQTQNAATPRSEGVSLREVDIRAFIEDVSNATGRTFIIDPRVTGRVSVMAQQSLSERDLFDVFLATLRVNGFVAVPTSSGAYRIVPDAVGAREPSAGGGPDHTYVTQVFTLRFADAESVSNAIRPMLSERGQSTINRRNNSVVVVDFGGTINRVRSVIERLDRDTSSMRSIRLENTSAAEMARVAQQLGGGIGDTSGSSPLQATPVASSNSLVLRGDQRLIDHVAPLIQQLDAEADNQGGVRVIALQYAVAEELLPILQQLSATMEQAVGEQPTAGRRANIAAHRATNSLIISADREMQESLATVVRSLDVRRQQILVEAIIVEVSDSTAQELGLQFLLADPEGNNGVPFLSTNYGGNAPNLLAITGALLVGEDDDGDNDALQDLRRAAVSSLIGARGLVGGVGGQRDDGSILGLILNAVAEDRDSNVLSTPSVMTLNNETASILVGQQIPVTTGEALGADFENQFRTVRREDVGVSLEVRPQISEGGAIRLEIKQEVSSIFGQIATDSTDLITNRRAIETVVQVDPGQVIVLGGLIQEEVEDTNSGIPGLRRIPIAGRLFSSEGQSRRRTNLMVFLRPTIVSTPAEARAATERQFRAVRGAQGFEPGIAARLESELSLPRDPAPAQEPQ